MSRASRSSVGRCVTCGLVSSNATSAIRTGLPFTFDFARKRSGSGAGMGAPSSVNARALTSANLWSSAASTSVVMPRRIAASNALTAMPASSAFARSHRTSSSIGGDVSNETRNRRRSTPPPRVSSSMARVLPKVQSVSLPPAPSQHRSAP